MRRLLLIVTLTAAAWAAPTPKILFAVQYEHGSFNIDPLVYVEKGRLRGALEARDGHELGRRALAFCDRFYRKGTRYTLLCQGRKAGEVQVVDDASPRAMAKEIASGGSGAFAATAAVEGTHPKRPWALAANFSLHGNHRVATGDAAQALAQSSYKWKGHAKGELLLTDLDGDGVPERLLTACESDKRARHDADPVGAAFRLSDASGAVLWERHDEEDVQEYIFVDQADLDGDGCDEIVLARQSYEALDYEILTRRGGKWKSVFRGGGGGA